MFSIALDLCGRKVIVVGGGPVGRRRALAAAQSGAIVTIIDPVARPLMLKQEIEWLSESYQSHHLDGAHLVMAAGPVAINERVSRDARERRIWVNVASDSGMGDFVIPAVETRGHVTITVHTEGASPSVSRHLSTILVEQIDECHIKWIDLLHQLRKHLKEVGVDQTTRREIVRELSNPDWPSRIRKAGVVVFSDACDEQLRRRGLPPV